MVPPGNSSPTPGHGQSSGHGLSDMNGSASRG